MTVEQLKGKRRFEMLLTGEAAAPHDRPLLECDDWLVAPTLGAIVPGWLLVIPRRPVLSFRDWVASGGRSPQAVLLSVQTHLALAPDEVIWFEHGPAKAGTSIGCGIDHAHLHILIRPSFTFTEFVDCVRTLADLQWQESDIAESYALVAGTASYCVAGSGECAISALGVDAAGSQFFRRVVASLVGAEATWDYHRFAHAHNIEASIVTFKRLESAARREP